MSKKVWVVTNTELGWDCVVAVFSTELSKEEVKKRFSEDSYVVQAHVIENDLSDWE